jgi:hypothetical protein
MPPLTWLCLLWAEFYKYFAPTALETEQNLENTLPPRMPAAGFGWRSAMQGIMNQAFTRGYFFG